MPRESWLDFTGCLGRPDFERMRLPNLTTLPVTTSEGRLLGVLERDTAKRALRELNSNSARTLCEESQP